MKRVAIYTRVSTDEQSTDSQLLALRTFAEQRGYNITYEFTDTMSGAIESRPGLDAMLAAAHKRAFDVLLVFKLDRLGRSTRQLILSLDALRTCGVDFVSYSEAGLDSASPHGKALFGILGVFAELEREMIRERVTAGLRAARARGKVLGRPRLNLDADIIALRDQGYTYQEISEQLGVSAGTISTALKKPLPPQAVNSTHK
jgi:putative DNA-invertase from lambdoid prophage Rac